MSPSDGASILGRDVCVREKSWREISKKLKKRDFYCEKLADSSENFVKHLLKSVLSLQRQLKSLPLPGRTPFARCYSLQCEVTFFGVFFLQSDWLRRTQNLIGQDKVKTTVAIWRGDRVRF
jgi:hypothetical protein